MKLLSLHAPYALHCDFNSGLFSVPLELSAQKESGLRYVNWSYGTGNYLVVRPDLENRLASLQVELNDVQVESFTSKEEHMMQLYCSRYVNNAYPLYWRLIGCAMLTPVSPTL